MDGLLILISMVTGTAAFFALFKPLPRLWLPTRKRAAVVWVASFVLLFIGAGLSPNPTPEELAAQKAEEQQQAEAKNFVSSGVGKKVPFDKWDIFGSPNTLDGTNGKYWVAYLPKIDVSFVSEKPSDDVIYVGSGKSALKKGLVVGMGLIGGLRNLSRIR